MILTNDKQKIDYLIKSKKKYLKEHNTLEGFEEEKKRTKIFVDSFNQEAKKQNSLWFAETEECKSMFDNHSFILTHLCKKVFSGWWIFRSYETIKLHICVYDTHTSFVENDYVVSGYGVEENKKVFHYLPEIKPILEKIPQVFFILPFEEIHNFYKELGRIAKDIKELKEKI